MTPLDIARSQIGTVETGGPHGNDGNVVPFWDWWDSITGEHDQGASWCGAFVSFCFDRAGARFTIGGKPGFIYCPSGEAWFRSQGLLVDATHAQPGDVAFFHFPGEPNEANHTGIIEAVDVAKRTVTSIDGNTSDNSLGSQSNGGGVYRRTRPWAMVRSVGHTAWVKPPAPPEDDMAITPPIKVTVKAHELRGFSTVDGVKLDTVRGTVARVEHEGAMKGVVPEFGIDWGADPAGDAIVWGQLAAPPLVDVDLHVQITHA